MSFRPFAAIAVLSFCFVAGVRTSTAAQLDVVKAEPEALLVGPFDPPLPGARDWSGALRVYVIGAVGLPAVAGEVRAEGKHLRFVPAFPFSRRAEYRVEFDHPEWGKLERRFQLEPATDVGPRSVVRAVYPSGDVLPQNQLKFYIHFTRPMSRGEAYDHIRLLDDKGAVVADPWLELAEELWDAEGMRLTVFLDPGRVKRGLKPHEDAGAVLHEGKDYRFVVGADWKDAERRPMAESFKKKFRTTAPDYLQPDPKRWDVSVPKAGSRDRLVVTFESALDHGLLERLLDIRDEVGKVVEGEFVIDNNETRWAFTPTKAWREGRFLLHAGSELEDLAGNSIRKPFEVTPENRGRLVVGPTVSRAFEITK